MNVFVRQEADGSLIYDCNSSTPIDPVKTLLGTYDLNTGMPTEALWSGAITETPAVGAVETWEIYNFTMDAHPIHIHLVQFQVVNRQALAPLDENGMAIPPAFPTGTPREPEVWESGFKDTVIVYPGELARVRAVFDDEGFSVWHCHILEHEDNEMMRPYHVGPVPADAPPL
jgi:FtsP/CotA-like multicopper oxidase with cupredoxin domain